MQAQNTHRVMSRKKAAFIVAVFLSILTLGVWHGLNWVDDSFQRLQELTTAEPVAGGEALSKWLRNLAVVNGIVLSLLAALVIWHGWRGMKTESMPPKGSWILEGQRVWTGLSAMRIAKFTIAVGLLLGLLAVISCLIIWRFGDTVSDQVHRGTYIRGHGVNEFTCCVSDRWNWTNNNAA